MKLTYSLKGDLMKYKIGDLVTLKKGHPCGENKWRIERLGAELKLTCLGCDRQIWMKRIDFDKRVRKIQKSDGKFISVVHYEPEDM